MKILSKQMILPMAAVAIIGAGALGVASVSAANDTTNPQASLIQKLADTLHVDKSKVQAVFDQDRTDRQATHEKNYEDRLTQAVTDGKLTAAQKTLLIAEHKKLAAEVKTAMDAAGTNAERRTAMNKIHTEATDWAKANNIDAKWLAGAGFGGRGHHGMMGGNHGDRMMDNDNDQDDTATPTPSPGV